MVEGLTEHVLIAAMYAAASASRLWEDCPSPPLAQVAQDAPDTGPTAEDIHRVLSTRAPLKTHSQVRPIQLVSWDAMDAPPATTEVHILKHREVWWTVEWDDHGKVRRATAHAPDDEIPLATRRPRPPHPRGSLGSAALRPLLGAGGARGPPPRRTHPSVDKRRHPLHGPHAPPRSRHRAPAPHLAHGPARRPTGGGGSPWPHDQAGVSAEGHRPQVRARRPSHQ